MPGLHVPQRKQILKLMFKRIHYTSSDVNLAGLHSLLTATVYDNNYHWNGMHGEGTGDTIQVIVASRNHAEVCRNLVFV